MDFPVIGSNGFSSKRVRDEKESSSLEGPDKKRQKNENGEKSIVDSFFETSSSPINSSSNIPLNDKKRKQEDFENFFFKIRTFELLTFSNPLKKVDIYGHLSKKAKKLIEKIEEIRNFEIQDALREIEQEWIEGDDQKAWEEKLFRGKDSFSREERISRQFKLIMQDPALQKKYAVELKIIYDLFQEKSQDKNILPASLRCITKFASYFGDEIEFIIQEKDKITIPKTCLLSCQSPYFNLFLTKPLFFESSGTSSIPLNNIDVENFNLLKKWLLSPEPKIFEDIEFKKILEFIKAAHQFDIPDLITHCDKALQYKIINKNSLLNYCTVVKIPEEDVVILLNQFTKFQKEFAHLNIELPLLKDTFIAALEYLGLYISSWSQDKLTLSLGVRKEYKQKEPQPQISEDGKIRYIKPKSKPFHLEGINLFQEIESISLDLSNLKVLSKEKKKELLSKLSNTQKLHLSLNSSKSGTNWDFLTDFKKLKELEITPIGDVRKEWFDKFKRAFLDKGWNIYFDLKNFGVRRSSIFAKKRKSLAILGVDEFVQLLCLQTPSTFFHDWPHEFKKLMTNEHITQLIDSNKLDYQSKELNLQGLQLVTLDLLKQIVSKMPSLETANFNIHPQSSLIELLPMVQTKLQEITFPLSFFHSNSSRDKAISFIKTFSQSKGKKLTILLAGSEENLTNLTIPQT